MCVPIQSYACVCMRIPAVHVSMNGNTGMQDAPRSNSPLPAATEVEEEEALMALADLSGSELLVCTV